MVFSDYINVLPVLRNGLFPFIVDVAEDCMGDHVSGCSLRAFGSSDINSDSRVVWLCLKFDYLDECSGSVVDSFLRSFRDSLMFRLSDAGVQDGLTLFDLFDALFDDCSVDLMPEHMFRVNFVVRPDFSMDSFNAVCSRVLK